MIKRTVRWLIGLFYLVGGPLIHIYFMTTDRAIYQMFDIFAWPVYQTLWETFVLTNLVPLVALLIVFEVVAGALMLSRQSRRAALGHLAGVLFNLALVPFWFFYGIPNVLVAALHAWLLQGELEKEPILRLQSMES